MIIGIVALAFIVGSVPVALNQWVEQDTVLYRYQVPVEGQTPTNTAGQPTATDAMTRSDAAAPPAPLPGEEAAGTAGEGLPVDDGSLAAGMPQGAAEEQQPLEPPISGEAIVAPHAGVVSMLEVTPAPRARAIDAVRQFSTGDQVAALTRLTALLDPTREDRPENRVAVVRLIGGLRREAAPALAAADVVLVLDLVPAQKVERLPEGASVNLLCVDIALLKLAAFEHSAHLKLLVALAGHTGRARSPR